MYSDLAIIAGFALVYSVMAGWVERGRLSGPILFVAFGMLAGQSGLDVLNISLSEEGLKLLAELTLAVLLFTDSAGSRLTILKRILALPVRLLLVGLPLTILLGFGAAVVLFPQLSLLEAGILGTMLAPTDAALGKAVVTNADVPVEVREGLSFESGLNDGICVPVLLVLLALESGDSGQSAAALAMSFAVHELGIGLAVGVGLALAAALLIRVAVSRDWMTAHWSKLPMFALGVVSFALAQALGGSGFIASFVGGLTFGSCFVSEASQANKEELLDAAELNGDLLALVTWLFFGAVVVPTAFSHADPRTLGYAALSLTGVRMLPVFLSLAGARAETVSKLFLGWFGPRGLASIVFCVLVLDAELPNGELLGAVASWTILLSVVAHGMSASPLARAYAKRLAAS